MTGDLLVATFCCTATQLYRANPLIQ